MTSDDSPFIEPVVIAGAVHPDQAEIWRGVLEEHGIAAFVWHGLAGFPPLYPGPLQTCRLAVEADAIDEARAILLAPVPEVPPEGWADETTGEIDPERITPPGPLLLAWVGLWVGVGIFFLIVLDAFFSPQTRTIVNDTPPVERVKLMFYYPIRCAAGGLMLGIFLHPVGLARRGSRNSRIFLRVLGFLLVLLFFLMR